MNLLELLLVLGTVIGIVDGQTIRVKDDAGKTITVKLACINVPKATNGLKQMLPSASPVVIRSTEQLASDRTVGEVYLNNRSVNLLLVESGNAVVDRETIQDCYENKTQYLIAEANAKNQHLGLWQQSKKSTWRGKLIYEQIPPVMSVRAYRGEEFFLITNNPNQSRLVLRPSVQVSRDKLRSLHNQQVEITAEYIAGTRPTLAQTACPLEADGQCMRQGDGYQVLSILPLKPNNK
ncbi:thermonuclease family protein [Nostoc sp. FACHB-152]|uniref:thermonuclease family protein n=1 Tax=unclassified Nostoc TaxID=2593658 RepID=UPI0016828B31|nr:MULTISPECIES: thermonuclease family protein [unclassified Nostoc]MBD2451330.1 thermonuclease family protein [Nostoc sp. FACHB-152]MBD2466291.1 thermonuclease family protein [Nostoc sp. FACHB-145]